MNIRIDEISNRQQVFDLLGETRDLKLVKGNPESVLERARKAYRIASNTRSPWREVAAYRLAQLLFRLPAKGVEEYIEIDSLLKQAAGDSIRGVSPLGPLPWIFRMASLYRLSIVDPTNESKYRVDLEETRMATMRPFLRRHRSLEDVSPIERNLGEAQIQSDQFNLIEFATFLVDLPYDPLLGIGDRTDDEFPLKGKWILVSNRMESGTVQYTREFAEAEVAALLESNPASIGFQLKQKRNDGFWLSSENALQFDAAGANQLALLSAVIRNGDLTSSKLQDHLSISEENLRQLKRRLTKELNRRAGKNVAEFVPGSFRLESEIPIFGAVNVSVLNRI